MVWGTLRTGILGPGFAAEEFLTAKIAMDRERLEDPLSAETGAAGPVGGHRPFTSRFGTLQTELARQLRAEPGVSGVTMAASVPGDEPWATIEVEGIQQQENGIFGLSNLVQFNQVDDAFSTSTTFRS